MTPAVEVNRLSFRYGPAFEPVLRDVSLALAPGSRCLLVGANGAGKTTLLRVIAGKHMIDREAVRVLGRPAFHDTSLARRCVFLGGPFPLDVDLTVAEVLDGQAVGRRARPGLSAEEAQAKQRADQQRLEQLTDMLGVDRRWHMHRVSDGQRRRVQILLGLLSDPEVLLLDEVTTDLDLLARADLLNYLERQCEERGLTVLYASHILDRLQSWCSQLVYLEQGRITRDIAASEIPEQPGYGNAGPTAPLVALVESWLRSERSIRESGK